MVRAGGAVGHIHDQAIKLAEHCVPAALAWLNITHEICDARTQRICNAYQGAEARVYLATLDPRQICGVYACALRENISAQTRPHPEFLNARASNR